MKCREIQPVMRTLMVRALSFSAVAALMFNQTVTPVLAADYYRGAAAAPIAADGQMNARFLALGIGKSVIIDLPRDVKDVLVADPKIANAVVRSPPRASSPRSRTRNLRGSFPTRRIPRSPPRLSADRCGPNFWRSASASP